MEDGLDDLPGGVPQLLGREPVGVAEEAVVQHPRELRGVLVQRQQVLDAGQDDGDVAVQVPGQGLVGAPEKLADLGLEVVLARAVGGQDGRPAHDLGAGPGMEPVEAADAAQRLGEAAGYAGQLQLLRRMAGRRDQAEVLKAQGQDVKTSIAGEQREERLQVETGLHHGQLVELERQAVGAEQLRGTEDGQAVALGLPEGGIVEQAAQGLQQLAGRAAGKPHPLKPLLQGAQQVLEPDGVLLRLAAGPDGGHIERKAGTPGDLKEILDVLAADRPPGGNLDVVSGEQCHGGYLLGEWTIPAPERRRDSPSKPARPVPRSPLSPGGRGEAGRERVGRVRV